MARGSLSLPALQGGLLALLAAALFGISTPLVQRLGAGLGAFTTAALLYAGAAVVGALSLRTAAHEARLQRSDAWRLIGMAGFGAARMLNGARSTLAVVIISVLVLAEGFAAPIEINRHWGGAENIPPDHVLPAAGAPAVYQYIKTMPAGTAVTEFPFGDAAWEIRYTYYAASHWKPITNGYSGNFSPSYKERVARLQHISKDPEGAWASLEDSRSTHAVIHRNAFADPAVADTVESWLKAHGAIEIARFDNDILLSLN